MLRNTINARPVAMKGKTMNRLAITLLGAACAVAPRRSG